MTTMAKVIRKAEKKAQRKANKQNRREIVETHNLTFAHQQLIEAQTKPPAPVVDLNGAWESPFRKDTTKAPSLKEMFFIQEDTSTEPQQG